MPTLTLNPALDTSLLSWAPDTEQYQSPILTVMNPHVAQSLLEFTNISLPNSTIISAATLQLRVTASVDDPTIYLRKTRSFVEDETFNSYGNDTLQKTYPSPVVAASINPSGYVTFDVKNIVQEWIMFPGPHRNACLYLDAPSDQSKLELSSMQGGIQPVLLIEY